VGQRGRRRRERALGTRPLHVNLRVPVDCGAGYGIAPGDRVFRGVGFVVPGPRVRFATPDVPSTIGACATALRVDNTTLRPLTPEEIVYWDQEPMDAGVSWMDGGMDGGVDGGRMGMFTEPDTDSNCTIGVGRRASFGPWALLLVVIFAVLRRPPSQHSLSRSRARTADLATLGVVETAAARRRQKGTVLDGSITHDAAAPCS